MPMMYNPAGGAQRAGGGSPPSNSRQTNLQRIDQAAMRRRKDKRPAQGQSPALPGVPQLPVAGLPEQQQQQRQQQPMQQPSQAQQSAQQQQQQGQAALPSYVGGAMGQMIPRGGGGFGMTAEEREAEREGEGTGGTWTSSGGRGDTPMTV